MPNNAYQFLGIIKKAGGLSTGYETALTDVKSGKCRLLLIAQDASDNTKKKFVDAAQFRKVSYLFFESKERLGLILGREEISAVSVKDESFAKSFIEKLKNEYGGEIIDNES